MIVIAMVFLPHLPFENKILGQAREIRDRMTEGVEKFVFELLTNVFNAADTAPLVTEAILKNESYDPGPKAESLEDPIEWTAEKIKEKAKSLPEDKGPSGNFDD